MTGQGPSRARSVAQCRFELDEGLLDRVEIWAVGWQVELFALRDRRGTHSGASAAMGHTGQ